MIILLLFLFVSSVFAQDSLSNKNNEFFSISNVKKFGDYLYCQRDYLRAINEYNRFSVLKIEDTTQFKIVLGYQKMGYYKNAIHEINLIPNSSKFYDISRAEFYKILFLEKNYDDLIFTISKMKEEKNYKYLNELNKLYYFSYLYTDNILPSKNEFLNAFPDSEKNEVNNFYNIKKDPPYKSPLLAGILSAVIPGSGKIYSGDVGNGLISFTVNVLLGYLAYTNFSHDHNIRAWIFSGLGVFFYAGNIYGSVASAQLFNAKVNFNFINGLNIYIDKKNYFLPDYNFCK